MPLGLRRRLPANVRRWIKLDEKIQCRFGPPLEGEPPRLPDKEYIELERERYNRSVRNHLRYKHWWPSEFEELKKKYLSISSDSISLTDKIATIKELMEMDHTRGILTYLRSNEDFYIEPAQLAYQLGALLEQSDSKG